MKTYTIGKIKLTQQALYVFIAAIVTVIAQFLIGRRMNTPSKILALNLVIGFGMATYVTYLTNCTIVGKCEQLAWFLFAINALLATLTVALLVKPSLVSFMIRK